MADGVLLGGKWENFHKRTITSFFSKSSNEVFFLAGLSLSLYVGSFFVTVYCIFEYLKQTSFLLNFCLLINLFCFIPAIRRVLKLHALFNLNDIIGEIKSADTYYNIQYRLIKIAKDTSDINELIEKLRDGNEKFNQFLIANHISLYKAIDLEKLFYSFIFPDIPDIAPAKEFLEKDKIIKYVSDLAEKKNVAIYHLIYNGMCF